MAKYKVTGIIEAAGAPALQNGLTAELISPLPVTVETDLSRKVEVKEGTYLVVTDTSYPAERISTLLLPHEAREIAHGLLAAIGDPVPAPWDGKSEPPTGVDKIRDSDGDLWYRIGSDRWSMEASRSYSGASKWEYTREYGPFEVA